jgi:NADH-quinone oxidoreductase subunit N
LTAALRGKEDDDLVDPFDANLVATLKFVFMLEVPETVLVVAACVIFLGGTFRAGRSLWGTAALVGIAIAALAIRVGPHPDFAVLVPTVSPIWPDRLAFLTRILALAGGGALVLLSWDEVPDAQSADFHGCLLLITAGTALVGSANELITLFLALELISIPTYVLLYLPRSDRPAREAAAKYFLLSIFSSGIVLFGFSYLYGVTGTTMIPAIVEALTSAESGGGAVPSLALVGIVMVVAGLGFRITAVPFHFYAPDVYQGTATSAATLLAYLPKVAGFVALVRLLGDVPITPTAVALAPEYVLGGHVMLFLWILAAITMTLGNALALWQDNVQRILAYSSVAHSGYMLIGLAVAPQYVGVARGAVPGGVESVLFYLAAYGAMTVGTFGVLAVLNAAGRRIERVDDLAGLGRTHPGLGLLMTLFLFSLIGLPLTAGFAGKYFIFMGALAGPRSDTLATGDQMGGLARWLVLVGAINAAIGAYYYLRIIGAMYLRGALKPLARPQSIPGLTAVVVCAFLTIWLGITPSGALKLAQAATTPVEVKR